ncbi:hypothetical protein PYW08_005975 [Mythimna loreyi]|uniref:Uncharacterized protein n=1 Tax=Mythimna loreyi TaxID=667449 RepID=A0ACC2QQC4_9NEOP|nr:hypothetical protein PYW08_005975 [Mythimna loreyi]
MALLTYILILHLLNVAFSNTCVIKNTPDYITWEEDLLKELETDYDAFYPPGENTTVNSSFFLESFSYTDKTEMITMKTLMVSRWKDERLKWDPEKHHGISEVVKSHFFILWTPYFGISNTDGYYLDNYKYNLKSNGDVSWQYKTTQEAWCSIKLTNWPYDVQECNITLNSMEDSYMSYSIQPSKHYEINFAFGVLEKKSAGWYIYDYKHVKENNATNIVKLTIYLMREAVGLSAIVVWPAFVLTVLSVVSLCLDVRRKVRLAIICLSVFGHYYFLSELAYDIPKQSNFPPTLLLYYRGSVVLSIINVLLTFSLDIICKLKSTPHNYVKLINDFVYDNKYRTYLVFPRWDVDDATVDSKSSSEDWVKFANIVNSIFIFIVVFAYIGLYSTNIPKQTIYHTGVDNKYLILIV